MGATEDFFIEKLEELEDFLLDPDHAVLRLVIDPEMRRVPVNYLVRREEEADFPHILLSFAQDFKSPYTWYARLLEEFESEIERHRESLQTAGVDLEALGRAGGQSEKPWVLFLQRAGAIARSLPDSVGSLVFLLEAEEIGDPENFARGINYLADTTVSVWLKFIVVESRLDPVLEGLKDHPKVCSQLFWLSPEG